MRVELLTGLLRHRRAIVLGALATVTAAAWAYLLLGGRIEMEMMDMGGAAMLPTWSPTYGALISIMWWVMMVAMMLPTAAPTVLLVTTLAWERQDDSSHLVPTTAMLFALGYLLVWSGFSLGATLLQWCLDGAGLLSEKMAFGDAILASTVLIAAGVYQWTPLKDACLRHCRSPSEFLFRHLRLGLLGAVGTGVRHGLFCLGCCWMLMAPLFVGGLMSLTWVGAIALFVLVEKTMWGDWISRIGGALLVVWGVINLIRMA